MTCTEAPAILAVRPSRFLVCRSCSGVISISCFRFFWIVECISITLNPQYVDQRYCKFCPERASICVTSETCLAASGADQLARFRHSRGALEPACQARPAGGEGRPQQGWRRQTDRFRRDLSRFFPGRSRSSPAHQMPCHGRLATPVAVCDRGGKGTM